MLRKIETALMFAATEQLDTLIEIHQGDLLRRHVQGRSVHLLSAADSICPCRDAAFLDTYTR